MPPWPRVSRTRKREGAVVARTCWPVLLWRQTPASARLLTSRKKVKRKQLWTREIPQKRSWRCCQVGGTEATTNVHRGANTRGDPARGRIQEFDAARSTSSLCACVILALFVRDFVCRVKIPTGSDGEQPPDRDHLLVNKMVSRADRYGARARDPEGRPQTIRAATSSFKYG